MIAIKLAAIERISVEANSVNIQSNIDTIPKINVDTAIPKNSQLKILIFKLVYLQINLIIFIFTPLKCIMNQKDFFVKKKLFEEWKRQSIFTSHIYPLTII